MRLFALLQSLDPTVDPKYCKVHLASWNGIEDPLHVYFEGRFDKWQAEQPKRNFERPLVLSLIALPAPHSWLFVGVHDSNGCRWDEKVQRAFYTLSRRPSTDELDGRLVVRFERPGRQSYLRAERWVESLEVAQLLPNRLSVARFPGYTSTVVTKAELDVIVGQGVESWKAALESVAGVYVIADRRTGKLYVGSATGIGGIWSRWCSYSATGHGGNKQLRELLRRAGADYAENFVYGVLEIADTNASPDDVLGREARWKDLLLTREHGLN